MGILSRALHLLRESVAASRANDPAKLEREDTAWHESGHVAAAWFFGCDVAASWVAERGRRPVPGAPGQTQVAPACISATIARLGYAGYVRQQNVIQLAGDVVDTRRCAKSGGHARQIETVSGLLALEEAMPEADAIVAAAWDTIGAVAGALLKARRGTLTARDLQQLRAKHAAGSIRSGIAE